MRRFLAPGGIAALILGGLAAWADEAPKAPDTPKVKAVEDPAAKFDLEDLRALRRALPDIGGAGEKKYRDFAELTKGSEKIDGLFTLHKKDDHLYAEIKPFQFDQPLLLPITIARGMGRVGMPVDDAMVLVFRKSGDKVQLLRRNIYYKAPADSTLDKAVRQNYTDSVLAALPILSVNPSGGMSTVVDLSEVFLTDFAQLGIGFLDRGRTSWHRVKGFRNNLELEVEATFGGGRGGFRGDGVADPRGVTLVIHYSLLRSPEPGYRPRVADDRIGYFVDVVKDFGSTNPDTNVVRYINRWRLEKADPRAKLSPPKKQIVWYVEDTVPIEYRPYVEAGILEWNKAFERIGIRNAMAVRWQQEGRDEFDPEDANYCALRWVTSDAGFAMSCFRSNPMTGEIIDGDVIVDAGSFLRSWKQQYALLLGPGAGGSKSEGEPPVRAVAEVISPILAAREGFGLLPAPLAQVLQLEAGGTQAVPAEWGGLQEPLQRRLARGSSRVCRMGGTLHDEVGLAGLAMAAAGGPGESGTLPEEFLQQGFKDLVMHEVGHSLGLRHNFKSSTLLPAEKLHDTAVTRKDGLTGSVMDYSPVNVAPKGRKQGDYFTTTLGPYDYWAIEYGYKPIDGDEAADLKKIAARAAEPGLAFGTDEDMILNNDPEVNQWDLGSDPCKFARDRMALAADLMKTLDDRVVQDGESWARNRRAFAALLSQWGNAATLVSGYVGGQSVHRHHKGDKGARDPVVPIAGAKQRECLALLVDQILSDKAFRFSPALLRRLAAERWLDWGADPHAGPVSPEFPVLQRVLAIQRIALDRCLSPRVLSRLQNQELQADPGSDPLRIEEVFRALTDGIWSDLAAPAAGDKEKAKDRPAKLALSTIRRNLQREYLRRLYTIVLGRPAGGDGPVFLLILGGDPGLSNPVPADARALARLHLKEIGDRIGKALDAKDSAIDDTTRAHLEECRQRIAKVLDAPLNANEG